MDEFSNVVGIEAWVDVSVDWSWSKSYAIFPCWRSEEISIAFIVMNYVMFKGKEMILYDRLLCYNEVLMCQAAEYPQYEDLCYFLWIEEAVCLLRKELWAPLKHNLCILL